MVPTAFVLSCLVLAATPPSLEQVRIVGRAADGLSWSTGPVEARADQQPKLALIAVGKEAGHRVVFVDDEIKPLVVDGVAVPDRQRHDWSELGTTQVRWLRVEPHAWREKGKKAKNGVDAEYHSNVSLEPATFGKWLGFDEITYFENELVSFSEGAAARKISARIQPSNADEDLFHGLGTMHFKVELKQADGKVLATAGAEATDTFGLKLSVQRVSVRADDTFVGYLTGFLLVPEVFGSAGEGNNNQTDRYVGADCADVLVGALRSMGYREVGYTNVAALPALSKVVSKPVDFDPDKGTVKPIPGVKVGDLVRIDYGGDLAGATPRSWDHVGVLYEDRSDPNGPFHGGPDGQLDGFDLLIHMGHPHLVIEPLSGQLPAKIDVLRWDPKKLGTRTDPSKPRS